MSTLTVRNLDPEVAEALKALGAAHGRSMEAEARMILAAAVSSPPPSVTEGLGTRIRRRFADLDVDLDDLRAPDAPRAADLDA